MRHKCIACSNDLDTANRADNPGARAQMKFCSDACQRKHHNARYYHTHRQSIIQSVVARRKKK
jgi:hypothetical protein